MQQEIAMEGKVVPYTLKRSLRARGMTIAVRAKGVVVLTLPTRTKESVGLDFLKKKRAWILKSLAHYKKFEEKQAGKKRLGSTRADYLRAKAGTEALVRARLLHFNTFYGFKYKVVKVKNVKTRWGSCSARGNLNFSYKLRLLPAELSDYIVVHELCHLGEMNHGPRFWKLVEKTIPDYKKRRNMLKHDYLS